MRKLLVILLLCALPLHFSWAVAAPYCQHESGAAAQHFGHHYHHHHQDAGDGQDPAGKPSANHHADCGACHLSSVGLAIAFQFDSSIAPGFLLAADSPSGLPSVVPDGPERPKWFPAA